jgi:hypothetical protein
MERYAKEEEQQLWGGCGGNRSTVLFLGFEVLTSVVMKCYLLGYNAV